MSDGRIRRCAVYTRKSSEEGLEQDFNSLQAQRESCESFIRSQRGEGWRLIPDAFDDGGISGGTMVRPALRRLLSDIEAGQVDVIVVYKVDRLTRSLSDFSKMVELFDRKGVSFVAVTQQFNTTSSMGRLTLNVLLSFAQFEREVTGERIRDKVAASKRKGMWMGGGLPRGYRVEDRKLMVVPEQAEEVRTIYREFLGCSGLRELGTKLWPLGILARSRSGEGKKPISRGALHQLLRNPIYVGLIPHKKERHPGQHEEIVDRALWEQVQAKLDAGSSDRSGARVTEPSSLLGKLFDEQGRGLTPSHTNKRGRRYRYYQSRVDDLDADQQSGHEPRNWRLPAQAIERQVSAIVEAMLSDRAATGTLAMAAGSCIGEVESLLAVTAKATPEERLDWVERVQIANDQLRIVVSLPSAKPIRLEQTVPMMLRRRGIERRIVIAAESEAKQDRDPRVMKALRTGIEYWEQTGSGLPLNAKEYAKREGLEERFVARALPLTFLAPDIVKALIEGRLSPEWTAERLLRIDRLPLSWKAQRVMLGMS